MNATTPANAPQNGSSSAPPAYQPGQISKSVALELESLWSVNGVPKDQLQPIQHGQLDLDVSAWLAFRLTGVVHHEHKTGRIQYENLPHVESHDDALALVREQIDSGLEGQSIAQSWLDQWFKSPSTKYRDIKDKFSLHTYGKRCYRWEACDTCKGHGQHTCTGTKCQGRGRWNCNMCDYLCQITCWNCHGEGRNWSVDRYYTCGTCNGGGRVQCNHCRGAGHFICQYCRGSGRENCSPCGQTGYFTYVYNGSIQAETSYFTHTPFGAAATEPVKEWLKENGNKDFLLASSQVKCGIARIEKGDNRKLAIRLDYKAVHSFAETQWDFTRSRLERYSASATHGKSQATETFLDNAMACFLESGEKNPVAIIQDAKKRRLSDMMLAAVSQGGRPNEEGFRFLKGMNHGAVSSRCLHALFEHISNAYKDLAWGASKSAWKFVGPLAVAGSIALGLTGMHGYLLGEWARRVGMPVHTAPESAIYATHAALLAGPVLLAWLAAYLISRAKLRSVNKGSKMVPSQRWLPFAGALTVGAMYFFATNSPYAVGYKPPEVAKKPAVQQLFRPAGSGRGN